MTLTIGRLAREFGLSRSTLLYYDHIGLLSPSGRGGTNYRFYSAADRARLEQILVYRQTGLSLNQIRDLLDNEKSDAATRLENKLEEINREIAALRQQQFLIINLLQNHTLIERLSLPTKEALLETLRAAGLDEAMQWNFHKQFEELFPDKHQSFLELLGVQPEEIRTIRTRVKETCPH